MEMYYSMITLGFYGIHLLKICKPKKWKTTDIFFIEDYLVKSNSQTIKISSINYMSTTYIIEVDLW